MEEKASLIEVVILYGTIGFLVLAGFIVYFVVLSRIRYNRYYREKKEIEQNFRQAILQSQVEIQEQTLSAVSQEIHDNIAQGLTLAKLNLHASGLPPDSEAGGRVQDAKDLIAKAIQDMRDLSRSLSSVKISEKGILYAIEQQLAMIRKAGGPEGRLLVTGGDISLDPKVELILFRIIQELLNNVLKHAAARTLTVEAAVAADLVRLTVRDDGKGFVPGSTAEQQQGETAGGDGVGLLNMRSRAAAIGAEFSLASSPGQGTTATITIPLPTHA